MQEFFIAPKICILNSYENFVREFNLCSDDLIITTEFLYQKYIEKFSNNIKVVFQDKFGLGEPTDEMIENIYKEIEGYEYKRVIAIGGGTVIDISKLFVLKNIMPLVDLFEKNIPAIKERDLIIIPTTCGTGSEVTNISIVNLLSKGTKKGLAIPELFPEYAILIEELVKDLPLSVFATSSIDALVHAVESALSPKATVYSEMFSYEALRKILYSYVKIKEEGLESRKKYINDILIASNMAGIAFGNAGCAAVHAMSYPLGGKYHVAHGESNYAMFIGVLKYYNQRKPDGKILRLNQEISKILNCKLEEVYDSLEELLNFFIKRKSLSEYGVKLEELEEFTELVMTQQQRLMANNYITLEKEDVYKIYNSLY